MSENNHHEHDNQTCDYCAVVPTPEVRKIEGHRFHIKGLDCGSCAMKIEERLKQKDYIRDAVVNFAAGTMTVDSDVEPEYLKDRIQKVVDTVESGVSVSIEKEQEKIRLFNIREHWMIAAGVLIYIAGMVSGNFLLYLAAYLLIGRNVLVNSIRNIAQGSLFDENFLMMIATVGAIIIGDYAEAVGVMLFYNIGELFQDYAVSTTRSSINSLMDLKEDYANVLVGNNMVETAVENVAVGDIIVVKIGEKVPLDGFITDGRTEVNTSSITGESVPVPKKEGEELLSGSVNLSNVIRMQVSSLYEDSTVAQIIDLLENSANTKARSEKFITRFSRVYTPVVVFLAVAVGVVIPLLFSLDMEVWLYRALVFLVVSCPCALVISVPIAIYAGIGKASSVGALIKGGNFLEMLSEIDTIVLDKTNTITKGNFEVLAVEGEILEDLAYAEYYSNHPIAKAIVSHYGKDIDGSRISEFKEIVGKGISVMVDGRKIQAGNAEYLREMGIEPAEVDTIYTVIHVAADGEYRGYLETGDVLKENAGEIITELNRNYRTVMLSGDRKTIAESVAAETGVSEVWSELLPADKVAKVSEMVNVGNKVMFVGDGINDGPVLARSNIGVAMGARGSELAKEAADIVLMNDNLKSILDVLKISGFTNRIIRENIVFALGVKVLVLVLAAFGIANMWLGVFADVGVALLAILNSLRILRIRL